MQPNLFDPPTPLHRNARDTERAAAEKVAPKAKAMRVRVLAMIFRLQSATCDEIAAAMNMKVTQIRPRVTQLAQIGFIEDSGERRKNADGNPAIVWRSARKGS